MERTEDEDRRGSLEEGLGGAEYEVRTEDMSGSEDEASTVSDERRNCTLCRYPRPVEYCGGHHIPSGRPRAEPPMFDYDDFIENKLPSDIRFSKLFPNDLVRWIRCRDVRTEELLLHNYLDWAGDMKHQAKDTAGEDFYAGLVNELEQDWSEAVGETVEAFDGASSLGRWEWEYLDPDGGTRGIQAWPARRWHYTMNCREIWIKYRHLAPPGSDPGLFWSIETKSFIKLDGTPCDIKGNIIVPNQYQQSTASSGDNPHSANNFPSHSPEPTAADKQEDGHGPAEEQQSSSCLPSPSQAEEEVSINYDNYGWYIGV